ncbi:MAG: STAS domain-containing protein [Chitinophagales bacterium]
MQYRIQRIEKAIVLMIEGKLLSEHETTPMRDQIINELKNGIIKFIIDLKDVEFVNSAFLNFLVSAKKLVTAQKGMIVLCNVPEQLKKLLSITKLESFFYTANRTSDAIAILK